MGVGGQDGFAQQGGEGALVLGDPGLDVVEAVVALGDEEEEPDGQDLARGERAFPVERGGEVAVQGGRQVQTLEGGPQDGQVGHGFDTQQAGFGWCSSRQSTHRRLSRKPPRTRANRRLYDLTSEVQIAIDDHLSKHGGSTDVSEMAQKAAGEAIARLAGPKKANTLSGTGSDEVQDALKIYRRRPDLPTWSSGSSAGSWLVF